MLTAVTVVYIVFIDMIRLFIGIMFALIASFMFGALISQGWVLRKFNKLEPLQEGTLRTRIEALATRFGFKVNRIFVMDGSKTSSHANAFFTELGKTKEIVLFDTLIEQLTEDGVVAVLAHENGHTVHKDATKFLVRNLVMVAVYALTLGLILTNDGFYTSFGLEGIQMGFAFVIMMLVLNLLILFSGYS